MPRHRVAARARCSESRAASRQPHYFTAIAVLLCKHFDDARTALSRARALGRPEAAYARLSKAIDDSEPKGPPTRKWLDVHGCLTEVPASRIEVPGRRSPAIKSTDPPIERRLERIVQTQFHGNSPARPGARAAARSPERGRRQVGAPARPGHPGSIEPLTAAEHGARTCPRTWERRWRQPRSPRALTCRRRAQAARRAWPSPYRAHRRRQGLRAGGCLS